MAHIRVEVNDEVLFDGVVDDWNLPPTPPQPPGHLKAADLPPSIRQVMARAMCKAIEKATGFKVDIH